MGTCIGKVKDRFSIKGRGVVVVTDRMTEDLVGLVNLGDAVEIRSGGATVVRTVIKDVAALPGKEGHPFGFLTETGVVKEKVAVGAEVWVEHAAV